jgi:hypothetical protein
MDETWVRAVRRRAIPLRAYSVLTRAYFITRMNRLLDGFMIVSTAKRPVDISTGAVVGRAGYLVLPTVSRRVAERKGYDWSLRRRDTLCTALRARESAIFPIQYMLRVPIVGESFLRGGRIE